MDDEESINDELLSRVKRICKRAANYDQKTSYSNLRNEVRAITFPPCPQNLIS